MYIATLTAIFVFFSCAFADVVLRPEALQLSRDDIGDFSDIAFGNANDVASIGPNTECRSIPGDPGWPSDGEWSSLNASIDGALLKPEPAAAACYPGPNYDQQRCRFLVETAASVRCRNTGHDFGGRSVGAGSLSIWVHHLKDFELIPEYTQGNYTGPAVRYGAGIEAWEMYNFMAANGITLVAPGGSTVGGAGGWLSSGGHSSITSTFGLGADQALSIEVVTADGRVVTADPEINTDLFWALRGGGGATYGIITSVIMKAYASINLTTSSLTLGTPSPISDIDTFWQAVSLYYRFCADILDAGGFGFSYIYPGANNSYRFTTSSQFPGKTPSEVRDFMQPLYSELDRIGVNMVNPTPTTRVFGSPRGGGGDRPVNTRYRSRLLPRENWEDDELFNRTMAAIREATEGGYENDFYFHGTLTSPTEEVAGWPGRDSAVIPAWRNNRMHAMLMDLQPVGITAAEARDRDAMMQTYMQLLRDVSPGAGSYMNEGDPGEPNWQEAFYGDHYTRLLKIKRARDPWGLFWAPTTVGSEGWEVQPLDGYPNSQNGRLCRVTHLS
ncbi:hypothetical protein DL768_008080 [Monosporascus sp. mg162]|nr:hypothetical protein DL768_008080 [Monosporascus sp. mg162]